MRRRDISVAGGDEGSLTAFDTLYSPAHLGLLCDPCLALDRSKRFMSDKRSHRNDIEVSIRPSLDDTKC